MTKPEWWVSLRSTHPTRYNPAIGRFTRLDPFAGNASDPQSLHKYLYTHANPVMGIDPTGRVTLVNVFGATSWGSFIAWRAADAAIGAATSIAADLILAGERDPSTIAFNALIGAGVGLIGGGTVSAFRAVGQVVARKFVEQIGFRVAIRLATTFGGYSISAAYETLAASWQIQRDTGRWPTYEDVWRMYQANLAVSFFAGFLPDATIQALNAKGASVIADIANHRANGSGRGWPDYLNRLTKHEREVNVYLARFFESIDRNLPWQLTQLGLTFLGGLTAAEQQEELNLD